MAPGTTPLNCDNIIEEHFSRNPRIVAGLYQWGYIEELGLGVDLMIEEMTRAGHPPPQFKDTPYSFTVTLQNIRERAPLPTWTRAMNERQARALAYVQERGRITNREYRSICPDVSAETLRLDLVDLVLVMTVEPGFGGQAFRADQLPKIREIRGMIEAAARPIHLEVDGGIAEDTAGSVVAAGGKMLVAGSSVFRHPRGIRHAVDALLCAH